MLKKQLVMAFFVGAVFVGAGFFIIDNLEGETPRNVPSSSQTLTFPQKAIETKHMVVHQLTTPMPLGAPIAYGYINNKGKIVGGSGNFTCERDYEGGSWRISIANINYVEGEFITFVTPSYTAGCVPTTGAGNTNAQNENKLSICLVYNGACQTAAFQFITYKIP